MQVLVDINWRPVFFEEEGKAKEVIFPYVEKGDILKMSDEEAEWLYNVPRDTALHHPEEVRTTARIRPPPLLHCKQFKSHKARTTYGRETLKAQELQMLTERQTLSHALLI